MEPVEMITVPAKEYWEMVRKADWANCLENAGVDNWDGCDAAIDEFDTMYPEED